MTALPFEAVKLKPVPPAQPKSPGRLYVGLGVAAALIFAAIAVVVEATAEKIKANDLEQQEALRTILRRSS